MSVTSTEASRSPVSVSPRPGHALVIGAAGFAWCSLALGLSTVGLMNAAGSSMILSGTFFYGGIVQLVAGFFALAAGATFAAAFLTAYGAFWLGYTAIQVWVAPHIAAVYASSTTTDAELTATLNVLSPAGTVVKQADGVLLGSQRQLDPAQSWYGTGSVLLQPAHPFTQQSQQPVVPGRTTRYDISLLANFTLIPAGDRIQVVITSQPPANFHLPLAPTPQELANLAGGTYLVDHGAATASVLDLPLASPGHFSASPVNWGPSS